MPLDWLRDLNELFKRLGRAASDCTVDLASGPYIVTAYIHLSTPEGETPKRFVEPAALAAWLQMFPTVLDELFPPIAAAAGFDEERTIASLLYVIELVTRSEREDGSVALAIASGTITLDTALRQRELARLTESLARAEEQLDAAKPVVSDPMALRALDEASFIRGDDIAIPVHPAATVTSGELAADNGQLTTMLAVPGTIAQMRDYYRAWARRDGWLIQEDNGDDESHELRLARHAHRLYLLITKWIDDERPTMVMVGLRANGAVRFEPGRAALAAASDVHARTANGSPAPPPVTRTWPAFLPTLRATPESSDALTIIAGITPLPPVRGAWSPHHLVADRGLLYVAESEVIWCLDPRSGRVERLAGTRSEGPFQSIGGLALLGDDTLAISDRITGDVHLLELATGHLRVLASGLVRPTVLANVEGLLCVACGAAEVHTIDPATGTKNPLASSFHNIRALAAHGASLFVADDEALRRVKIETRAVTIVVPRRFMGIASDGTQLYATTYDTIEQITPSMQTVLVGRGRKPRNDPDGLANDANVSDAVSPAWDGGGLVFITNDRLRRFDLTSRDVTTLGVPPRNDDALRGTLVGVGSLGGSRLAIGFRQPASFIVFNFATGARETFPLEIGDTKLRALATDGHDRVFVTDHDGRAWSFVISTRWLQRIDAIAEADKPTAIAFPPDRLYLALATPGTIVEVDLATRQHRIVASGLPRTTALAVDVTRNLLYASDAQIMRIDLASGAIEAVTDAKYAGSLDGPRGVARFLGRDHLAVAPNGDLYVSSHTAIRHIRVSDGYVSTAVAGLQRPEALCLLPTSGLALAIVDGKQNVILRARL